MGLARKSAFAGADVVDFLSLPQVVIVYTDPNACGVLASLGIIGPEDTDAPEELKEAVRFAYRQGRKLEEQDRRFGYYPSASVPIRWPVVGQDEEWLLEVHLDEIDDDKIVIASIELIMKISLH